MKNFTYQILFSVYTLITIISGFIYGNKKLAQKENCKIKGFYFTWFAIKQFFISLILFFIILLVAASLSESKILIYFLVLIFGVLNFLYAKHKVFEEYEIMFKPGEGVLTPEGRQRLIELDKKEQVDEF